MTQPTLMIGLGEILWDFLPSGKMLGGAPANFAYMASVLGNEGVVASRIGNDNLGREVLDMMRQMRLSSAFVQEDPEHLTGMAGVRLRADGQPEFEIKDSVSWDFLEWTPIWADLASSADVVCYGTLAQRSPISRETIQQFLRAVSENALLVYDVNLRGAFFTIEILRNSFMLAHIAKLNVDELFQVSDLLNTGGSNEEERALRLLNEFDLRMICVTRGSEGSFLMSKDKTVVHSGFRIRVADAVGAGDSFTACLAHNYVLGKSLEEISESANRLAAWVATQAGATPAIPREGLHEALQEIA
jgi:fructokinase